MNPVYIDLVASVVSTLKMTNDLDHEVLTFINRKDELLKHQAISSFIASWEQGHMLYKRLRLRKRRTAENASDHLMQELTSILNLLRMRVGRQMMKYGPDSKYNQAYRKMYRIMQ